MKVYCSIWLESFCRCLYFNSVLLSFQKDDLKKARKFAEDLQRNKHRMSIVCVYLHHRIMRVHYSMFLLAFKFQMPVEISMHRDSRVVREKTRKYVGLVYE